MKVTYYGHSCFMVEFLDKRLLFDPFISGNDLVKDVDISGIKPTHILVTHGHQDHVLDVEVIAKQSGATLISNFEIVTWFEKKGLSQTIPMNHGGTIDLGDGVMVKYVNAVHTSSMPDGAYGGAPGGFVVSSSEEGTFYYSGDTALTYDMKLIGEEFDLDFALLCLGDQFTMGVQDAVKASDFVGAKTVIGMHYDTWPPLEINHQEAQKSFADSQKTLLLPAIGETITP